MYSHTPADYKCPICPGVKGIENDDTLLRQTDLVYQDELVTVFVNSFWLKTVEGHVIVVTNEHYENIYDMPAEVGHRVFDVTQKMAQVIKQAYGCDGITTRQNNEPAADQHAFHFHQHVFPRYNGDHFNDSNLPEEKFRADPDERRLRAQQLKSALDSFANETMPL